MQTITSENTYTDVDGAVLDRLTTQATKAGLTESDLDDAVHDCCDTTASRRVNTDDTVAEMPIEQAQDHVYAEVSAIGSEVNNSGLRNQIAFLLAELGEQETAEILTEFGA